MEYIKKDKKNISSSEQIDEKRIIKLYNKEDGFDRIHSEYQSIRRVGIMNAEERAVNPSIEPIFGEANNGEFMAFPLSEDNFMLVPNTWYTFSTPKYLRGGLGFVFEYLGFNKEKEYSPEFSLIQPAYFKFNHGAWECVKKGIICEKYEEDNTPSKEVEKETEQETEQERQKLAEKDKLLKTETEEQPADKAESEIEFREPKEVEKEQETSLDVAPAFWSEIESEVSDISQNNDKVKAIIKEITEERLNLDAVKQGIEALKEGLKKLLEIEKPDELDEQDIADQKENLIRYLILEKILLGEIKTKEVGEKVTKAQKQTLEHPASEQLPEQPAEVQVPEKVEEEKPGEEIEKEKAEILREVERTERVLKFGEIRKKLEEFNQAREEMAQAEKKGKGVAEAREKYEKMRAEYVGEKIWRDLKEQEKMTEAKAENFKGLFGKFYAWSSNKYLIPKGWVEAINNWQPETKKGKAGKILAKIGLNCTSVRNITSYGLLGAGIAAGATGIGAGAAVGAIALRRGLSGMGTGFGMYNTLNRIADWRENKKDVHKSLDEQELNNIESKKLIDRLEYFEAKARVRGQKVKELDNYQNYRNLKFELNKRFKKNFEGAENRGKDIKGWLSRARFGMGKTLEEHYNQEKTKDKKIKAASLGAGIFTGLGGIRITGKGIWDLVGGEGAEGFKQAGSQEFNAYKELFFDKGDIDEVDAITAGAEQPVELEPKGSETPLVTEELKFEKPIPKTILDEKVGEYPRVVDEEFIKQEAQKSFEQKYGAAGVIETATEVKPKIPEIYSGQMEDAMVKKGEGVINVIQKQLEENEELAKKLGFNSDTDNLSEWANKKANNLAFNQGYGEVGVRGPGKIAYLLDEQGKINRIDLSSGQQITPEDIGKYEKVYKSPIKEIPVEPMPEKPIVTLEQEPVPQEIATPEVTVNDRIIANYENMFEHPEERIISGQSPNEIASDAVKGLEDYLTQKDLGQPENFQELQNNLARLDNTEILERFSHSDNNLLADAAHEAEQNLLVKGTAIERINNLLELKSPKIENLKGLRNLISEAVEAHIPEVKGNEANLFSQVVGQSKEQFQAVFGKGAVTQNKITDWFETFKQMAQSKEMPEKYEFWQPRQDADGRIFNALRHSKLGGQEEFWIDTNGDGKLDKIIADENDLKKIMGIKEIVKDELSEVPQNTAVGLDETNKPVFEQKTNFPESEPQPDQELSTKTGKITEKSFTDEQGRIVSQKNIEANLTGELAKKAYNESRKVAVDLVYNKSIKNPEQFLERIKEIKGAELTDEEKVNWQQVYKQVMAPNKIKPVDNIERLTNFIIHPELTKMLAEQQIRAEAIK